MNTIARIVLFTCLIFAMIVTGVGIASATRGEGGLFHKINPGTGECTSKYFENYPPEGQGWVEGDCPDEQPTTSPTDVPTIVPTDVTPEPTETEITPVPTDVTPEPTETEITPVPTYVTPIPTGTTPPQPTAMTPVVKKNPNGCYENWIDLQIRKFIETFIRKSQNACVRYNGPGLRDRLPNGNLAPKQ